MGRLSWHQSPTKTTPTPWSQTPHNSLFAVVMDNLHSQSAGGSILPTDMSIAIKAQLQQKGTHNSQRGQGTPLEHLAQVTKETSPPGLTGHLLHKATLPRVRDIADLPNI